MTSIFAKLAVVIFLTLGFITQEVEARNLKNLLQRKAHGGYKTYMLPKNLQTVIRDSTPATAPPAKSGPPLKNSTAPLPSSSAQNNSAVKAPPANNTQKPEPLKNVSAPPAPPAKNDTNAVTTPAPVEEPKNANGGSDTQQEAKSTTNTTAPTQKPVDYTEFDKAAEEDARIFWNSFKKKYDNDGSGWVNFCEVLRENARENGIQVNRIRYDELRQKFMDINGDNHVGEFEIRAYFTSYFRSMADKGIPLEQIKYPSDQLL